VLDFLRGLTRDWKLKLLAFVLGVLLWVVVSAEQTTSGWVAVPVSVDLRDPEFRVENGPLPPQVEVRFSGTMRELVELSTSRPRLVLPVPQVDDESQVFVVSPDMVRVRAGLGVSAHDVRPSTVRIVFDRVEWRSVPVQVVVEREPSEPLTLVGPPVPSPSTMRISGPAAAIQGVELLRTVPVDLSDVEGTFVRTVEIDTTGLGQARPARRTVQVTGRAERVMERIFTSIPVFAPPDLLVAPEAVEIRLIGAEEVVQGISPAALRAVVPPESVPERLPATGVLVPLRVEGVPEGLWVETRPSAIRVLPATVEVDGAIPRTLDTLPPGAEP
jgi:hypothetical protein